jgi:hypothetical protein
MTAEEAFVEPAYGTRSLGDVIPAVGRALGAPGAAGPAPSDLELPEAPSYVVFLVDGLGARLLERYAHAAPYLASLVDGQAAATAAVPSTTATSLASFGTGLTPGQHGLVGFTSRVPGTDQLLNALAWDSDVDPQEWQPHPTAFDRLGRAGVEVTVVNKREFARSGLTIAAHRGGTYIGADKAGERIAGAVSASASATAAAPSLTYLYDGDLDWTGHRHGVTSSAWLQQLAMVDAEAEQLREALPPATRLLVVADHGMVEPPPEARVDVDAVDGLRDGVALLGGEARFRHLYCHTGAVEDVVATWRAQLGARAEVLTRGEAAGRGWFGDLTAPVRPRVGDVVVACRGDLALMSSADFPYEQRLVGLHGSLTPEEMLVPVLLG